MISFKKVWNDVNNLVNDNGGNVNIVNKIKNVFLVEEEGNVVFLTKDDFVDFWAKLFSHKKVDKSNLRVESSNKELYIYQLVKELPYIKEEGNMIYLANN